jgi:hypothetical protein
MSERETYEQGADWLIGTVKRNPEALLVLAAGCALLMRGKASRDDGARLAADRYRGTEPPWQGNDRSPGISPGDAIARATEGVRDAAGNVRDAAGRVQDTVQGYAADMTNRVSERASDYASTVSDYAGGVRRAVTSGVSQFPEQARATVQQGFSRLLREQPLAIAVMGVAAGATLAAIFPVSEVESQALGPAHDAVVDAASRAADTVKAAAGEAGEQLKQAARERGLDPEGLKGLAREVGGNFADNVTGRATEKASNEAPGLVPDTQGVGTGR